MSHVFENAVSGRASCRGCQKPIAKGSLRFGERLPNPFAEDSEITHWYHPPCAAYKRPEPFLEATDQDGENLDEVDSLIAEARRGIHHRRLVRINGSDIAPTGRAKCRCCREAIALNTERVVLSWYEEGRFTPAGFVHMDCAKEYFGTSDIRQRVEQFGAAPSVRISATSVRKPKRKSTTKKQRPAS